MRRRRRRILILVSILLALVGTYALIGFVVVPATARDRILQRISAALGREVWIEDLHFNPFTFEAGIEGLRVAAAGEEPVATCQSVSVNLNPFVSLVTQAWRFGELRLTAPSARLAIDADGHLNIADVISRIQHARPGQQNPEYGWPAGVWVESLAIQDGRIHYEDNSRVPAFSTTVEPINIRLTEFSTAAEGRGRYRLEARTARNETFTWDGTVEVSPFRSSGRLVFRGIDLAAYRSFLASVMRGQLTQGRADASADYSLSFGPEHRAELRAVTVLLDSVAAALPDHAEASLELRLGKLQAGHIDILAREVQLERASFESLTVRAVRLADGTLDLARFLPANGNGPSHKSTNDAPRALALTFGEVTINDGLVAFDDRTTPEPVSLRLDQLALTLGGAPSSADEPIPLQLQARWQGGPGLIQASGWLRRRPLGIDLELRGSDIAIAPLQGYLRPVARVTIDQGSLDTQGRLATLAPQGEPTRLTWSGSAEIRHLAARDTVLEAPLFGCQSLAIERASIRLTPLEIRLPNAVLRGPVLHVTRTSDAQINLAAAFVSGRPGPGDGEPSRNGGPAWVPSATSAAKQRLASIGEEDVDVVRSTASTGRPPFLLENLTIASGTVVMEDHRAKPMVATRLTELEGTAAMASSGPNSPARIQITATVDESASLALEGTAHLVSRETPASREVSVRLDNLALKLLEPYATGFLGYRIDGGRARADLAYTITSGRLEGRNHIVLRNFALGQRVPGEQGLDIPVQLALSVLRDRNGEIEVQLPIQGDLGSSRFDFASAAKEALRSVLVRAATAPFSMLGSLFGSDAETLRQLEFPPGSARTTKDEMSTIKTLAEILQNRPGLALRIHWAPAADVDTPELRLMTLDTLIRERDQELTAPATSNRNRPVDASPTAGPDESLALRSLFAERFPHEAPQAVQPLREPERNREQKRPSRFFVARFWRWMNPFDRDNRQIVQAEEQPTRASEPPRHDGRAFPSEASMRERLLNSIEIDESRLAELARARADHARAALADAGIESTRVEVATEPGLPESADNRDGMPRVTFELIPASQLHEVAPASQ